MIEYVPYSKEHVDAHCKFALKMWNKKVRTDPDYVQWKFTRHDGNEGYSLFLAIANGEVIAQLGTITCSISNGNQVDKAAWWCDLMIDPDYRGKGISKHLYKFVIEKMDCILLGSDPSPAAEISMKRIGFQEINSTDKYLLPVNIPNFLRLKISWIPKWINFDNFIFRSLFYSIKSSYKEISLSELNPEILNSIIPVKVSDTFQIHTLESLKWRFKLRPLHYLKHWVFIDEKSHECFLLYVSGNHMNMIAINNSKLNIKSALRKAYSIAKYEKLDYIHLRLPAETIDKKTALFLVKSTYSTKILAMNHSRISINRFSYSLLDSDEAI